MESVYRMEKPLFWVVLLLSTLIWLAAIIGSFGIVLIYIAIGFVFYLFIQSGFISWIRGNGVQVTEKQFPELYQQFTECCEKLGLRIKPEIYIVNSDGILNALATKFLGDHFVVLYSEVVEALEDRPEALKFYLGHELCHIKRNHLNWGPILWPGMLLPHIGPAYSRAREYTCDQYGLLCCNSIEDAERALAVLASGDSLWKKMDIGEYRRQAWMTSGFWMSFHEFTGDYPWLVKRIENVRAKHEQRPRETPRRSIMAFLLACLVPRLGSGGAAMLFLVIYLGILAAIAIPAYQDYTVRAHVSEVIQDVTPVNAHLVDYYNRTQSWPSSLEETGYTGPRSSEYIQDIYMDEEQDLIVVISEKVGKGLGGKMFYYTPYLDENEKVKMDCGNIDMKPAHLPENCR